jgi:hypothetical protein
VDRTVVVIRASHAVRASVSRINTISLAAQRDPPVAPAIAATISRIGLASSDLSPMGDLALGLAE